MTKWEQLNNWLATGLEQSPTRLSELFYYDKRDNEFFSVLVTDYFMLDENMDPAESMTTTYAEQNLEVLVNRMKRIESNDATIISLPKLGDLIASDPSLITQQLEIFLEENAIKLETATIWEAEEETSIVFDLKDKPEIKAGKSWWKFWK